MLATQTVKRGFFFFTVVAYGLTDKYAHAEKCEEFLSVLPHRHKTLGEKIEFSPRRVFRTCVLFLKMSFFHRFMKWKYGALS